MYGDPRPPRAGGARHWMNECTRGASGEPLPHIPLCPAAASSSRGPGTPKGRPVYPRRRPVYPSTRPVIPSTRPAPFPSSGPGITSPAAPVPGLGPTGAESCTPRCASPPPQTLCGVCPLKFSPDVMAAPPKPWDAKVPSGGTGTHGCQLSLKTSPLPQLRQVNPKLVTLGFGSDRRTPQRTRVQGEPWAGDTRGCSLGGTCHPSPMAGLWHPFPTDWVSPTPAAGWGEASPPPCGTWHMSPCMGWLCGATQTTALWSTGGHTGPFNHW